MDDALKAGHLAELILSAYNEAPPLELNDPFESYVNQVKHRLFQDPRRFRQRFVRGYLLLTTALQT